MNFRKGFSPFVIFLLILLVFTAGIALARAGGGQSYGGSSSRSSNGGGDGLGILIYFLLRLCIEQPAIGIPLVIVIIVVSIGVKKKRLKKQYSTIQRAGNRNLNQSQDSVATQTALANIKQRDPQFTAAALIKKADAAFLEIQKAWSDQNLSKVRRFISDGVNERFSLQIDMQKKQGIRNEMEDVQILGTEITSIESDSHFDSIHLKITARAKDTDVDIVTGRKIRDNFSGTFVEYWSFLRKPGVQTLAGKGLVEGVCPNCGAHLELSDSGKCLYCDAVITSGEYDWVLSEITQSIEWSTAANPSAVPGYTQMLEIDPGFNLQTIEDTASVIFWRYIKSYFDNSADPVRKMATEGYSDSLAKSLGNVRDDKSHLFFADAAVGAVEVQTIAQSADFDRIQVLVKWSAANRWIDHTGKAKGGGPKTIRPQIFTLLRKHGVATLAATQLNSAHCPGCGAPYTGGDSGSCEYCGRPLNDGSGAWVLESIGPFSSARINSAGVSPVAGTSNVSPDILLMAMASTMYADGVLDDKEMDMLSSFASHRGISSEHLSAIIASITQPDAQLPRPANTAEAMEVLKAMVRMSLADGRIDDSEKALLQNYAASAGLSKYEVSSTIAKQRRYLYREAKKATKAK
ncbi:MAG: TIM44-like domain-containing protein [Candidatus Sabulitectum sp.]|nr:TIM44-like domain-containing protein [Candidatus Sabulitectum sp.]